MLHQPGLSPSSAAELFTHKRPHRRATEHAYAAVMSSPTGRFGPTPIIAIHVLAAIGVLFWISQIVGAFLDGNRPVAVLIVGIVLGGAHVLISRFTSMHSRKAFAAMWFVVIGDSLLTIFVNWKAIGLVGFTIVLLLLTRTAAGRRWFATS